MSFRLLTKTDIAVICCILLSAILQIIYSIMNKQPNTNITISYNNQIHSTASLSDEIFIQIEPHAVIEIKDNKARIISSTCKNQVCVRQGWSTRTPIICVPNKIIIEFSDIKNTQAHDRLFITK